MHHKFVIRTATWSSAHNRSAKRNRPSFQDYSFQSCIWRSDLNTSIAYCTLPEFSAAAQQFICYTWSGSRPVWRAVRPLTAAA